MKTNKELLERQELALVQITRLQERNQEAEGVIQELREEVRRQHLATKESRTREEKDVDEAENSGVDKNMVQVILPLPESCSSVCSCYWFYL